MSHLPGGAKTDDPKVVEIWLAHQDADPVAVADEWWHHVGTLFVHAFRALGVDEGRLSEGVAAVRTRYCDPGRFQLFPDTIPAMRALRARGWSTVILSNHVPELPSIVEGLGLGQFVDDTLSSARTGFEKPHPEAFRLGLRGMDDSAAWMVGDNPVADVGGAEAVGIRAILVRRTDPASEAAGRQCGGRRRADSRRPTHPLSTAVPLGRAVTYRLVGEPPAAMMVEMVEPMPLFRRRPWPRAETS